MKPVMKFLFEEIGTDWALQATVDYNEDTRDEVAAACRLMAAKINAALGRDAVQFSEDFDA